MRGTRHQAIKYCAYTLLLVATFTLQSARGVLPILWGGKADVLPFLVAAIALFEGPYAAGAIGFAAGIMVSIHSPMIEGLSALYLLLFGVGYGIFGGLYIRRVMPAALLGGALCMVFQGLVRYVFYFRLVYDIEISYGAWILAGELILSVLPGMLVFYAVRAVHRRFTEVDSL